MYFYLFLFYFFVDLVISYVVVYTLTTHRIRGSIPRGEWVLSQSDMYCPIHQSSVSDLEWGYYWVGA